MKQGWEIKKLGDLCEIKTGRRDANHGNQNGVYHFFTCAKNHSYIDDYSFDTEAILVAGNGDVGAVKYFKGKFDAYQRTYVLKNFESTINVRFLFLLLDGYLKDTVTKQKLGNTMPYIKVGMLKSFQVQLPSPPEQKRIVEILDKAFVAIDKAKQNAEQNLKNAKEVFQSTLQSIFDNGKLKAENGEWEENKLGECFRLKSGDGLTSKNMNMKGVYDVYGGNGIAGKHDKYNLNRNFVIIGRVGALCGIARHINDRVWLTDNAFKAINYNYDLDNSFLVFMLNHRNLRQFARQAAQPVISNSSLKDVILLFPKSIQEQKQIVTQLDQLQAKTKHLEKIYQQKLDNLIEIKKSILQQAFDGKI